MIKKIMILTSMLYSLYSLSQTVNSVESVAFLLPDEATEVDKTNLNPNNKKDKIVMIEDHVFKINNMYLGFSETDIVSLKTNFLEDHKKGNDNMMWTMEIDPSNFNSKIIEMNNYKALTLYFNGNDFANYIFYIQNKENTELLSGTLSFENSQYNEATNILNDFLESVRFLSDPTVIVANFNMNKAGWISSGSVTTTLEGGRLKVSNVNSSWEGIKRPLDELIITPGTKLNISLNFDKGTTNAAVRLYVQELKADGSHSSWNVINGNLQTGSYNYEYTIKEGYKAILRIDKSNTHLGETTEFYVDNIVVSQCKQALYYKLAPPCYSLVWLPLICN